MHENPICGTLGIQDGCHHGPHILKNAISLLPIDIEWWFWCLRYVYEGDETVKTKITYAFPIIMSAESSKFKLAAITTQNY